MEKFNSFVIIAYIYHCNFRGIKNQIQILTSKPNNFIHCYSLDPANSKHFTSKTNFFILLDYRKENKLMDFIIRGVYFHFFIFYNFFIFFFRKSINRIVYLVVCCLSLNYPVKEIYQQVCKTREHCASSFSKNEIRNKSDLM